jgi:putative peptide zinc metalloprotease protein
VVRGVAAALRPFFWPGVVGAAHAGLAVIDVWLFGVHGLGRGLHDLFARPALALLVLALVLLSAAFHECGHAAACKYGGARPGAMGVGLYLAWPVFYTDVTDAYRLSKGGRVRTDLGGVYFNVLFILATAGVYFQTRFELLLVVIAIEHATMIQQLAPWFRLDGYYVITDLTGVPDVLSRTRPVLRSLLPGRRPDPRVQELKPWVRGVVTAYVVTLVPALAFFYALLVLGAPRFFAAAARGLRLQADHASVAWHAHDASALALAALQFLGFAVPALGMSVLLAVLARRVALVVRRRVRLRGIVVFAAGAAAAVLAIAWWNSAPDVPAATPAKSHVPTRHRAHVVQRAVPAPVHRTEARNVSAPAATTASRPRTLTPPPTTRSVTTTRQRPASQPPASAAPTTTTAEPAPTTTTASTIPTDTTPTTTTEATMTTTTTDTTPTTTTTTTTTTP